jgi:hypothetical protein
MKVLQEMNVFTMTAGREHTHFKGFTANKMKKENEQKLQNWIKKQCQGLLNSTS